MKKLFFSGLGVLLGCDVQPNRMCFEDPGSSEPLCFEKVYTQHINPGARIEVADLDRDGASELLEWGDGKVWIVRHKYGGRFTRELLLNSHGKRVMDVIAKDLNRDNRPDLVVSVRRDNSAELGQLIVFLQQEDGFLELSPQQPFRSMRELQSGDFNNDAITDLAFFAFDPVTWQEGLFVLSGVGDGTFSYAATLTTNTNYSMMVVDLDQDQFSDILVSEAGDFDRLDFFRNQRATQGVSFDERLKLADTNNGSKLHGVIDLNQDGQLDILLQSFSGIDLVLNQGELIQLYDRSPFWASIADINGDGLPDLFNSMVGGPGLLLGQRDGTFLEAPEPEALHEVDLTSEHRTADINGDSYLDVVFEHFDMTTVYLYVP